MSSNGTPALHGFVPNVALGSIFFDLAFARPGKTIVRRLFSGTNALRARAMRNIEGKTVQKSDE